MSYVDDNLMPGEKVKYRAKLHWIVFAQSIPLFIIGILSMGTGGELGIAVGGIFILLAIVSALISFISYSSSEFAVTDKRFIAKVGLIKRETVELLLSKVEAIQVQQTVPGRIFGYGTITVSGTGGSKDPFNKISSPMKFRKCAQEQIAAVQG